MVKVTKHFFIDSDEHNFIVCEKRMVKEGKRAGQEVYRQQGFYGTFEQALVGILKELTRRAINKYDMDLNEAIAKIQEIEEKIMNVTKK